MHLRIKRKKLRLRQGQLMQESTQKWKRSNGEDLLTECRKWSKELVIIEVTTAYFNKERKKRYGLKQTNSQRLMGR